MGIAPLLELIAQVVSDRGTKGPGETAPFLRGPHGVQLLPKTFFGPGHPGPLCNRRGSFGYKGRITQMFEKIMAEGGFRPFELYSCGPLASAPRSRLGAYKRYARPAFDGIAHACGIGLSGWPSQRRHRRPGIRTLRNTCAKTVQFFGRIYQMEQNPGPTDASPDLAVQLGPLSLENPVMSASGTFGYGEDSRTSLTCAVWGRL